MACNGPGSASGCLHHSAAGGRQQKQTCRHEALPCPRPRNQFDFIVVLLAAGRKCRFHESHGASSLEGQMTGFRREGACSNKKHRVRACVRVCECVNVRACAEASVMLAPRTCAGCSDMWVHQL
eukprot:3218529-Amphidinium_carterae.3